MKEENSSQGSVECGSYQSGAVYGNRVDDAPTSSETFPAESLSELRQKRAINVFGIALLSFVCVYLGSRLVSSQDQNAVDQISSKRAHVDHNLPLEGSAWSSIAAPFSVVDPLKLGLPEAKRNGIATPGPIFGEMMNAGAPLPTNTWFENLLIGGTNTGVENKVFQVPYVVDTGGAIPGMRTHPAHVFANDRQVMMTYELQNGLCLGSVDKFLKQHTIRTNKNKARNPLQISKIAIELEWQSAAYKAGDLRSPAMRAPIVRGAPYLSMEYIHATPRIVVERKIIGDGLIVDNDKHKLLRCGLGKGNFSTNPILVNRELKLLVDGADFTWLIFVSEPTEFTCSEEDLGADSPMHYFDLRSTKPMRRGMVRAALSNNCTTGLSPEYCPAIGTPRDSMEFEQLLRTHADIYPTAESDTEFTFPVQSIEEEEMRVNFNFRSANMAHLSMLADEDTDDSVDDLHTSSVPTTSAGYPEIELLMFALPHHQERLRPVVSRSSNRVLEAGCSPTLHGMACPVLGSFWSLVEHLHRVSFTALRPPRDEMIPAIQASLKQDIHYTPPRNYMIGAGDTYFSGKMLAKLARIILVADEVGGVDPGDFRDAVNRLKEGTQVWLNGTAESMLMYDTSWGGVVACGCNYDGATGHCSNKFPDCPALVDMGQNFGAGFYNDHHFHYGYHIYAAAVAAKFDHSWGKKYYEHVLLLVRDIANPSQADPFFPVWRHKDWYLGFSWASGVVTFQGQPNPNGRNQESASESIAAYEAVAMFGDTMAEVFGGDIDDFKKKDDCVRIRDMGRLLMSMEVRSMITYWHVQDRSAAAPRIYPDIYAPKIVGMMWSVMAQEQTWFGNEPWESYGIQLMPLTPVSELRDSPVDWVDEMLPDFSTSCEASPACTNEGWSILVYSCMATAGKWETAWGGVDGLDDSVYEAAGGNGHSRTNTLWYIATRPDQQQKDEISARF